MTSRRAKRQKRTGHQEWSAATKRAEAIAKKNTAMIEAGETFAAQKPNTYKRQIRRD